MSAHGGARRAPRARGSGGVRVLVAVVALAVVAAGGWFAVGFLTGPEVLPDAEADAEADGPAPPERWDRRVEGLVAFVEEERGLRFDHPVRVRYLAPAAFEKSLVREGEERTAEDEADLERWAGLFRAIGLLADDVDLGAVTQTLTQASTVGYYAFDDRTIRVRGRELTPDVRRTLVHELTHALQDQHFAIGERFEELADAEDGTEASMLRMVTEGDAERVAAAFAPDDDGGPATRAEGRDQRRNERRLARIPRVLVGFTAAPYVLGPRLLDLAVVLDGDGAVDDLLRDPPASEEAVLDPWLHLREPDRTEVLDVEPPALGRRGEQFDSGTFGALGLYFMLAQRLEPREAMTATDGWGGDAYVGYEQGGRSCLRLAFRGDTEDDTRELAGALEAWAAAGPSDSGVERSGDGLVFTSCDPGGLGTEDPASEAVLSFPLSRTQLLEDMVAGGAPEDMARCYSRAVADQLTPEELATDEPTPELSARLRAMAQECAVSG